ncbi:TlpA disulfide reductase family protein [Pedobacter sp. P351]|uniref:TlpA family protein disulfide reductase n=1 Tax=Pedobacter superstes TaxID=3133441 RepID=UPI0030B17303
MAQKIDTSALNILQKSWDKFAAMETIPYRMRFVDTMMRENQLNIQWSNIRGTVKKNAYWYFKINDKLEWLIRGDTLYKKRTDASGVTFTTQWNRHEIASRNINNILGNVRPALNNRIASLNFVRDTSDGDFYVIDEVYKRFDEGTEIQNLLHYERYFIDRKSLFASRRIKYGKSLLKGEEQTDIYDFSASLDSSPISFNPAVFFFASAESEENLLASLRIGTIAPPFKATDVRTGKSVSLEALNGKIVLLDFWYLACMPCRILMPKLQKLQEKFGKENVVVVGINVRDNGPRSITKFLEEKKIRYSQYYQPGQLLAWDYKLKAFPTTLVLGRDGKVKLAEIGADEGTEQKLELAIRRELDLKPVISNTASAKKTP